VPKRVERDFGIEPVCRYLVSPGGTTESMEIFCARVDSSKLSGIHGLAHEGEDIRVFTIAADEAISWVESGKIANSMTIIALQWLALNRSRLREKWLA